MNNVVSKCILNILPILFFKRVLRPQLLSPLSPLSPLRCLTFTLVLIKSQKRNFQYKDPYPLLVRPLKFSEDDDVSYFIFLLSYNFSDRYCKVFRNFYRWYPYRVN